MAWMDEKGRLFGFINIFDLLVLLLVVAGVALLFKAMIDRPKQVGLIREITVEAGDLKPEIAENIQAGDLVYNPKYIRNGPIAEVTEILDKQPALKITVDQMGNQVLSRNPVNKDVKFALRFVEPVEVRPTKMLFHQRPLSVRVGDEFTVMNHKYSLDVQVVSQKLLPVAP